MTAMSWTLIFSILLRLAALIWAIALARRLRDWRVVLLTILIAVPLGQQVYTLASAGGYPEPTTAPIGILVGTLALLAIYFLQQILSERDQALEALRQSESKLVTERKQAEEAREKLLEELKAKNDELNTKNDELNAKNDELERFTYTVSHDLKSPLVTLHGFLGLLKKDVADGQAERVERDIDRIQSATDTMQSLLEDLLELSRIGRMLNPPETIPLSVAAREAAERVAGRLAEHGIEVDIAPDMPAVFADRPRILQVLQHLIDNAAKFVGDGDPQIEIGTREDDDEIVCYVRDNGIGIEPRFHEKIFGLFERLDKAYDGTGLGLALVERIINIHDGRTWVESEGPGQGSTFYFALPRPAASQ